MWLAPSDRRAAITAPPASASSTLPGREFCASGCGWWSRPARQAREAEAAQQKAAAEGQRKAELQAERLAEERLRSAPEG